mgnify:FL=1
MATSKPLVICLHSSLANAPWVAELRAKGHTIVVNIDPSWETADLILGPQCARFVPGMEKYLDSFLKGARAARYPGSKRKDDSA